ACSRDENITSEVVYFTTKVWIFEYKIIPWLFATKCLRIVLFHFLCFAV
ncbi:hypothetical protein FOCC_FOCC013179, partial [Frankliniella occidentalis]